MSTIDPVTIQRWTALLQAATPGTWGRDTTDPGGPRHTENVVVNGWDVAVCSGADVPPENGRARQAAADADLIAESPTIIAALLAERLELLAALAARSRPPAASPSKPGYQIARCAAGHLTYAEPKASLAEACRCGAPLGHDRSAWQPMHKGR